MGSLLRYSFCKAITPEIEFLISDTLSVLRPRMARPATYAEATDRVAAFEAAIAKDARTAEAYAHELLHTSAEQRAAGNGGIWLGLDGITKMHEGP